MTAAHFGVASSPTVVIADTAAINGLGFDPATTWAFWRAEANGQQASPFRDDNGERATMVLVRTLPPTLTGAARLAHMLRDCLAQIAPSVDALGAGARVGVFLCLAARMHEASLPRPRADRAWLDGEVARWCLGRAGATHATTLAQGHASLAEAIARAGALLESGALDAALVGGPDGYHDADVVQGLLRAERLFDGKNLNSMIPGEGCALLLLTRPYDASRAGLRPQAVVESAGYDREPGGMFSDAHVTGMGLARALDVVAGRAAAWGRPIPWILGDLTNETYRGRELSLALPRAFAPGGLDDGGVSFATRATDDARADWLPVRFGDLGAATMSTAAVIACEAFARGDPSPRRCVILGSSESPARGAVMLAAPGG